MDNYPDKLISFNDYMVNATLAGNKTETRRPIKELIGVQTSDQQTRYECRHLLNNKKTDIKFGFRERESGVICAARYEPGEIVGIREAYQFYDSRVIYRERSNVFDDWRDASRMHPKHSRAILVIKSVHAERLQEITYNGCIAEGLSAADCGSESAMRDRFRNVWDDIYKKSHPWRRNDFVFVYKYKLINIRKNVKA